MANSLFGNVRAHLRNLTNLKCINWF